jgi:hypothetical protein
MLPVLATICVILTGCARGGVDLDRNIGMPPPGPYDGVPSHGTDTGTILAGSGLGMTSVGSQMMRDDDDLFNSLGDSKKTVGRATAGAGAALLTGALIDALGHDNTNHFAEYLDGTGAAQRILRGERTPADAERLDREKR